MNRINEKRTISLRSFVIQYILPLFFAVMVLVLISYFNELRSQETTDQLQALNDALTERDEHISVLETQVSGLEIQVSELESRVAALEDTQSRE